MGKVIFIRNGKGGVGKSTVSKNLAAGLAMAGEEGFHTAIISLDDQNDSLTLLGREFINGDPGIKAFLTGADDDVRIKIRHNLDYYPLEAEDLSTQMCEKFKTWINDLKEEYRYIIIDGSPKESHLAKAAATVADEILVPIYLKKLSINGIGRLMDSVDSDKIKYIVPNMFTRRELQIKKYAALKELLDDTGIFLSKPIPDSKVEEDLAEKGKSIWETKAKPAEKTQNIYVELLQEVLTWE